MQPTYSYVARVEARALSTALQRMHGFIAATEPVEGEDDASTARIRLDVIPEQSRIVLGRGSLQGSPHPWSMRLEMTAAVECAASEGTLSMWVNRFYLADCVSGVHSSGEVEIRFSTPLAPLTVRPAGRDAPVTGLMPMMGMDESPPAE